MTDDLVNYDDPLLRTHLRKFDFDGDMDAHTLVDMMHMIREKNGGIGLAANQIGINAQVLIVGTADWRQEFINPESVELHGEMIYLEEGCLSFPELYVKIKRPKGITLTYFDANGTIHNNSFDGMTSRVIQHELDHLKGITFEAIANPYHLEKAKKRREVKTRRNMSGF